jgi:hypothetical protein
VKDRLIDNLEGLEILQGKIVIEISEGIFFIFATIDVTPDTDYIEMNGVRYTRVDFDVPEVGAVGLQNDKSLYFFKELKYRK